MAKRKKTRIKIPQIDVQKTRVAIMDIAETIPSKKMFEIVLRSVDLMMDDIVEARNELSGKAVEDALSDWDRFFEAFGMREAVYYEQIKEADEATLQYVAAGPLFLGEYPKDIGLLDIPTWPDIETPWRLMNSLALIGAQAGKKKPYFETLKTRWMDNFKRYFKSAAIVLSKQEEISPEPQEIMLASGAYEEPSLYDQAAAKARGVVDDVGDFFSEKTAEQAKKAAKTVGISFGVGLAVGLAAAGFLLWRFRRR